MNSAKKFFTIFLAVSLLFSTCKRQSDSPCLKSIAAPADFAGFQRLPGGFIVAGYRSVPVGSKEFEPRVETGRATASFEFYADAEKDDYQVDLVTQAQNLSLEEIYELHIEVYYNGSYIKIPIIRSEEAAIERIFAAANAQGFDDDMMRYALSSLRQGPKSRVRGAQEPKSIRDYIFTEATKKICPSGACASTASLRVFRFTIDLRSERLKELYGEELGEDIKKTEYLTNGIKHFLKRVSEQRSEYVANLAKNKPDLYGSYAKFRAFQMAVLESERLEGYLHFLACMESEDKELAHCESRRSHEQFEDFKAFSKKFLEIEFTVKDAACKIVNFRDLPASVLATGAETGLCLDQFAKEQWAIGIPETEKAKAEDHQKILFGKDTAFAFKNDEEKSYETLNRLLLAQAKITAQFGYEAYRSFIEAAKKDAAVAQAFTNYVPPQAAAVKEETALQGVFYGGLPMPDNLAAVKEQSVRVSNQDIKFQPFEALKDVVLFSGTDEPTAVRVTWDDEAHQKNFVYCSQEGSSLMFHGLPFLAIYGGCPQAGSSVIIPAPYAKADDLLHSVGDEPVDEPDVRSGPAHGGEAIVEAPQSPVQQQEPIYSDHQQSEQPATDEKVAGCVSQ